MSRTPRESWVGKTVRLGNVLPGTLSLDCLVVEEKRYLFGLGRRLKVGPVGCGTAASGSAWVTWLPPRWWANVATAFGISGRWSLIRWPGRRDDEARDREMIQAYERGGDG